VYEQAPAFKPYQHDGSEEPLGTTEIQMPFSEFFKYLGFREDEFVWFAHETMTYGGELDGETRFLPWEIGMPALSMVAPSGNRLDEKSGRGFSDYGIYFAVNPFKTDASRKTANVSRFPYPFFESDTLSKGEQLAVYRKSGIQLPR
jgi:hypothetical protein